MHHRNPAQGRRRAGIAGAMDARDADDDQAPFSRLLHSL